MPRNQSEKRPEIPERFPLVSAPHQGWPPKFHKRLFWHAGKLLIEPWHPTYRKVQVSYLHARDEFTEADRREYNRSDERRYSLRMFYRQWWETYITSHAT